MYFVVEISKIQEGFGSLAKNVKVLNGYNWNNLWKVSIMSSSNPTFITEKCM